MKIAVEGTENQTVSARSRSQEPGLMSVRRSGQQTQAPRSQAQKRSSTELSKVSSAVCENRSCSVMA